MSNDEQTRALMEEIQRTINRFRSEFDINYATTIGAIEMVKIGLYLEAHEDDE